MDLWPQFETLTTAHLADGCLRARVPVRCARLQAVVPGSRPGGRVRPARHAGSAERRHAAQIRDGLSLRRQVRFDRYLTRRQQVPSLTFREHLRDVGGAIEV